MPAIEEHHDEPGSPHPVSRLLTLGPPEPGSDWSKPESLGLGAEQIPELIRLLQVEAVYEGEEPVYWAMVHAWRALGQLRAEAAVPALLALLWLIDEEGDDWVAEEVPVVLGQIGPTAVPAIAAYLADAEHGLWARTAAGGSLAQIGLQHPEARGACVDALSAQLEDYQIQDPALNGALISDLLDLRAVEKADVMAAAFAADAVDLSIQGDWEEVQIELGLLAKRLTPSPPEGWIPELSFLRRLEGSLPSATQGARAQAKQGHRSERQKAVQRKAHRKQEKVARRRQRRHR